MRVALDTNVLAYLARLERSDADGAKVVAIRKLLPLIAQRAEIVVSVQALGEFYSVLGKFGYSLADRKEATLRMRAQFGIVGSDESTLLSALDLACDHHLQFWDALIINVAADAECAMLLSEDMQNGFSWRGVTVVNPFADPLDTRLARLIDD